MSPNYLDSFEVRNPPLKSKRKKELPAAAVAAKKKKQKQNHSFAFRAVSRESRIHAMSPNITIPEVGHYHPKFTALEK